MKLRGTRAVYWSENKPKNCPQSPSISIRERGDGLGYEVVNKGSLSKWTVTVVEAGNEMVARAISDA